MCSMRQRRSWLSLLLVQSCLYPLGYNGTGKKWVSEYFPNPSTILILGFGNISKFRYFFSSVYLNLKNTGGFCTLLAAISMTRISPPKFSIQIKVTLLDPGCSVALAAWKLYQWCTFWHCWIISTGIIGSLTSHPRGAQVAAPHCTSINSWTTRLMLVQGGTAAWAGLLMLHKGHEKQQGCCSSCATKVL